MEMVENYSPKTYMLNTVVVIDIQDMQALPNHGSALKKLNLYFNFGTESLTYAHLQLENMRLSKY